MKTLTKTKRNTQMNLLIMILLETFMHHPKNRMSINAQKTIKLAK